MGSAFNEVLGTEVEIPDAPRRIISFSPAATETLFDLGAGDRVVGVSAFCARPAEAQKMRKVGSYNSVREELLDELDPDLILAVTGYQREFALKLSRKYPVYPLELPVSVAGIVDFVVKVGLVCGESERGRLLGGSLIRRLGGLKRSGGISVYVEIDLGGPVSFGAYSYITDAIGVLGGHSLFESERREWLKPSFDRVAEADPDMMVFEAKMFSKFSRSDLDGLLKTRGWTGLRAVRNDNCFLTPGPLDFLAHHGPSFITRALPWLEDAMAKAEESIDR